MKKNNFIYIATLIIVTLLFISCDYSQAKEDDSSQKSSVNALKTQNTDTSEKREVIKPASKIQLVAEIQRAVGKNNHDLNYIDTSAITDMSYLFSNPDTVGDKSYKLHSYTFDISGWDVSKVLDMSFMFAGNAVFNNDISEWKVSNVRSMANMFQHATKFNRNISRWDVEKVTSMHSMFSNATNFNRDLSIWDISKVTDMRNMFHNATEFLYTLNAWGSKLQSDAEKAMMFQGSGIVRGNPNNLPRWCNIYSSISTRCTLSSF